MADIPLDFGTLEPHGCFVGSHAVVVLSEHDDMKAVALNLMKFFEDESCGQCTPCREGSLWMQKITDRMLLGGGVIEDPKQLKTIGDNIAGRTICAFGEACAWPTQSFVQKFPEEFAARAQKPVPPPLPPEYTPEELIEEQSIATVPMARDPGWEKAGTKGTI
jgi:NADH-quinone oxidoreductase subunit F